MNPQEQAVTDLINQEIVTNGNNEITALVLNPVLIAMLAQANLTIGDITQLNTINKDSIVDAINWLNDQINNGASGGQFDTFLDVFDGNDIVFILPTGARGVASVCINSIMTANFDYNIVTRAVRITETEFYSGDDVYIRYSI